jgi:hypothetical protein
MAQPSRNREMSRVLSGFCAALAASGLLLAASGARAFTIENGDGGATGANLMAPSPFNDPVKKETDRNGGTRTQFGNSTVYVGPSSSVQQDYAIGINRMFSPLGRPPD